MASEPAVIIDAGPLVALLSERDHFHAWASDTAQNLPLPFITCESVISEACFLLHRNDASVDTLFHLLHRGSVEIAFDLQRDTRSISSLMHKFSGLPKGKHMSLADAALVRLSEIHPHASVFTTDAHFKIYRRNGRQLIPLIAPWIH
ncbi:MAG TPA: pilus assembly protein [Phycisphaerae bacterium]|jgi:predicted nucleic acid-binding protein|nr:pilus assembly protein [Phycisphaerae bacterium]